MLQYSPISDNLTPAPRLGQRLGAQDSPHVNVAEEPIIRLANNHQNSRWRTFYRFRNHRTCPHSRHQRYVFCCLPHREVVDRANAACMIFCEYDSEITTSATPPSGKRHKTLFFPHINTPRKNRVAGQQKFVGLLPCLLLPPSCPLLPCLEAQSPQRPSLHRGKKRRKKRRRRKKETKEGERERGNTSSRLVPKPP